ncbi:hypothetical protein L249_6044, partial [Ophiocordyceps polyrhachis-furcata BCC 54312]
TRPEGLGGSRDAGPAAAGPRPPYVTEAEGHVTPGRLQPARGRRTSQRLYVTAAEAATATPYSGYGRTGRTGPIQLASV